MPELPEVEVTRLSFANAIAGASIQEIHMGKPLRWGLGCDSMVLLGRTIVEVTRRGKYLLLHLQTGGVILMHLGMSGSLRFYPNAEIMPERGKHDHVDIKTTHGTLRLNDPRRFGAVVFSPSLSHDVATRLLGHLGMEPLQSNFSAPLFYDGLMSKKSPIKTVLLGGNVVVGVGNIYASEALFSAKIHPEQNANDLTLHQVQCLHAAIVDVLERAILFGGSTLNDFSSAKGEKGYFQLQTHVYGRANLPCHTTGCGTLVAKITQGQRPTFFCSKCQPLNHITNGGQHATTKIFRTKIN